VTEIRRLPAAPLHAVEIWSNPAAVAARFAEAGAALPTMGRSGPVLGATLLRVEPTVWLAEGDIAALLPLLGDDGSATAIGGGVVRFALTGPGWRALLMADGLFDAESRDFGVGACAATVIAHAAVRLWVEAADTVRVYVPASMAEGMEHHWRANLPLVG